MALTKVHGGTLLVHKLQTNAATICNAFGDRIVIPQLEKQLHTDSGKYIVCDDDRAYSLKEL